jgi:hypothetical protein
MSGAGPAGCSKNIRRMAFESKQTLDRGRNLAVDVSGPVPPGAWTGSHRSRSPRPGRREGSSRTRHERRVEGEGLGMWASVTTDGMATGVVVGAAGFLATFLL